MHSRRGYSHAQIQHISILFTIQLNIRRGAENEQTDIILKKKTPHNATNTQRTYHFFETLEERTSRRRF